MNSVGGEGRANCALGIVAKTLNFDSIDSCLYSEFSLLLYRHSIDAFRGVNDIFFNENGLRTA